MKRILTKSQRQQRRRVYMRKYYAQHRSKLRQINRAWRKKKDYDRQYYLAHQEERKEKARTRYHNADKLKRAAKLLVIGKVVLSSRDLVGNAELRAKARHRFGLTKPQLLKADRIARAQKQSINPVQSVTPKKPSKSTSPLNPIIATCMKPWPNKSC